MKTAFFSLISAIVQTVLQVKLFGIAVVMLCATSHTNASVLASTVEDANLFTSTSFLFQTDSLMPDADTLANQYGVPTMQVSLGSAASGWQDPFTNSFTISGRGGAWDIGSTDGSLAINVPITSAGNFTEKSLSFVVEAIYLNTMGIASMPTLGLPDEWVGPVVREVYPNFANQGLFDIWYRVVWQGTMNGYTGDSFDIALLSPPGVPTAVIDSVYVHTVIPEATTVAFLILFVVLLHVYRLRSYQTNV